jgi:hypothetical protein
MSHGYDHSRPTNPFAEAALKMPHVTALVFKKTGALDCNCLAALQICHTLITP